MKFLSLLFFILLTACGINQPKSSTPIPSDEFIAVAYYSDQLGSTEIAREEAEQFCKHWKATPGIIHTETIDLQVADDETLKTTAKQTAARVISTGKIFKKKFPYQTTITYKCY